MSASTSQATVGAGEGGVEIVGAAVVGLGVGAGTGTTGEGANVGFGVGPLSPQYFASHPGAGPNM